MRGAAWTDRELNVIKLALADGLTPREIAPLLPGRTIGTVEKRCSKARASECSWTAERIATLRQGIAAGLDYDELAAKLGVSYGAVKFKTRRLRLRLTEAGDRRRRHRRMESDTRATEQRADDAEQRRQRRQAESGDQRFCAAMQQAIRSRAEPSASVGVDQRPGTRHARRLAGAAPSSGCGSPAASCAEVA